MSSTNKTRALKQNGIRYTRYNETTCGKQEQVQDGDDERGSLLKRGAFKALMKLAGRTTWFYNIQSGFTTSWVGHDRRTWHDTLSTTTLIQLNSFQIILCRIVQVGYEGAICNWMLVILLRIGWIEPVGPATDPTAKYSWRRSLMVLLCSFTRTVYAMCEHVIQ